MLQEIKMKNGATGYKNTSNAWIWVYSQASVTVTDDSGNTLKITSSPCWVAPGWTINTGTTADVLMGLQSSDIREFAGFLSKSPSAAFLPVTYLGASIGISSFSAKATEREAASKGLMGGNALTEGETEAVTHN